MKKTGIKIICENRKARFDYFLGDTYEAGLVLVGTEIKSIRSGNVNISDSYVVIKDFEVFVINMHIAEYEKGNIFNHETNRTRKLLLHKQEIRRLVEIGKKDPSTLIPTKIYLKDGMAKLEFAIAKGKKNYDKREVEKKKTIDREIAKHVAK